MQENTAPTFIEKNTPITQNPSSVHKFLPVVVILLLAVLVFLGLFLLFFSKAKENSNIKTSITPSVLPSLTVPVPSIAFISNPLVNTGSTQSAEIRIDSIVFIKDGDIYTTSLDKYSLYVKNSTPGGDMLRWSESGKYLSWRDKTVSGVPDVLEVYDNQTKQKQIIGKKTDIISEIVDYAFSGDDKGIAILSKENGYNISIYSLSPDFKVKHAPFVLREAPIKQIVWPTTNQLIFSGTDGISSLDIGSSSAKLVVDNQRIQFLKLSPDRKKVLYSAGDENMSDLFVMNIENGESTKLEKKPANINTGDTGLDKNILEKGFIPFALWYPDSQKLLAGYHYQNNLPISGIYDLNSSTFSLIAPFYLNDKDFLTDDAHIAGLRVTDLNKEPYWQLNIFSIGKEEIKSVGVIDGVSSMSYFYR